MRDTRTADEASNRPLDGEAASVSPRITHHASGITHRHGPPWATIILFLLPAAVLYLGFTIYPTLMTFFNSVHILRPGRTLTYEFVGFQHYSVLLVEDDIFRQAALHSLAWAAASLVLEVPIAFALALILASNLRGTRFFRTAWFTPVLITYPVVGIVWLWIYNFDWGIVNVLLRLAGLGGLATAWLGNPTTALPALVLITTWMFVGFDMVILLAAIHAIPPEIVEAARIDGANRRQEIVRILIPLLRQTLVNLLILCFIGKMKQFALVYVMTRGGPMGATETVATYLIKRAFNWQTIDLGYPSAMAVVWFAIILGLTLLFGHLLHRREPLEY